MNNGRISRRAALLATGFMVFATPAFASLVVQNYMEADITVADACFVKVAGQDATTYGAPIDPDDPSAGFSADDTASTGDIIIVDGAELLEEKLTVRGMIGDRVTYTDVVRHQNNCKVSLTVRLVAGARPATAGWTDRSARIYVSDTTHVIGDPALLFADLGMPGSAASGWNGTPIVVDVGGAITTNTQTGPVVVDPGEEIYGAISVSAGVSALVSETGTVNWVAQATNTN
jgi:hypothetical protein